MARLIYTLSFLLLSLSFSPAAMLQPELSLSGALVKLKLGLCPVPHSVWSVGRDWRWNDPAAPPTLDTNIAASFCRDVRVPKLAEYYIIADTLEPSNVKDPLGIAHVSKGSKSLLWSYSYYENENSTRNPVKVFLEPGVNYKVCFTSCRQTFNMCKMDLYACQTEETCPQEREYYGKLTMSRRNR